jgi:hypothetical protein
MSTTAPSPSGIITTPEEEKNQLGGIRYFVLFLLAIVLVATLYMTLWVLWHREANVVRVHQPIFLFTICVGLLVWELAVIPLSIDDGIASQRGCDIACILATRLQIMGFTLAFAALFTKFMRINKLFHNPQFRRIQVTPKDVIKPFAVLFSINLTCLMVWTLVDPKHWEHLPIQEGNPDVTYGACIDIRDVAEAMSSITSFITFVALVLVLRQAWKARNISDEYSESHALGIAVLNWLHLI